MRAVILYGLPEVLASVSDFQIWCKYKFGLLPSADEYDFPIFRRRRFDIELTTTGRVKVTNPFSKSDDSQ